MSLEPLVYEALIKLLVYVERVKLLYYSSFTTVALLQ
jgi:hypothetical protein